MSDNAETKLKLTLGTIIVAISMTVAGASAYTAVMIKAGNNEKTIISHKAEDEKKWEKVDDLAADVHLLQLSDARGEAQHQEVMRILTKLQMDTEKINEKMDNLEVVD